ncbi:MAG: TraR/DksA C4-type zinc finger protein [Candidatus Eisenbacteria bacterium]|nr:TraR/DksA C4-type zinc finger protein [Candidatus Eisenbacteria bacterium]
MNKKELKHYRELLILELEKIADSQRRLERAARESSQREASGDLSAYSIHSADLGSDAMEREKDLLLAARGSRTARLIEDALRKIDEGTYGACDECGKPIAPKRLDLLPYASLCARCQRDAERTS